MSGTAGGVVMGGREVDVGSEVLLAWGCPLDCFCSISSRSSSLGGVGSGGAVM